MSSWEEQLNNDDAQTIAQNNGEDAGIFQWLRRMKGTKTFRELMKISDNVMKLQIARLSAKLYESILESGFKDLCLDSKKSPNIDHVQLMAWTEK